ncbi:UBAP1-MVB12-associated (UMA)-domain containing protein 1 [Anguilla rostrata]|uniref:UBAP1-MVB12-associated (UMA)-domain containing protein 1 n=1 Tax=Anguilla rostrata TaxID=7938 RepID=UPI0030D1641B
MLSFLGLRKDSKKSSSEKETDGFVIIGETAEEKRQKVQSVSLATNVIVLPSKSTNVNPAPPTLPYQPSPAPPVAAAEAAPFLPELLGDIPFTLAPHILAMQTGVPQIPDFILTRDINDNLASFRYDFTLENSVLCDS